MRTRRWRPFALIVASFLVGCGVPIEYGAHFESGWEVAPRATFAWDDEADHTHGDVRLEDNAFFHARLHEAVEWELNLRGLRHSDTNSDVTIHHHFSLADHQLEREVIDESGISRAETEIYEGGSVVLHLVDARTGQDRWVGWAQANVEPALVSPEAMRKWVYNLVDAMFARWPIPPRTAGN